MLLIDVGLVDAGQFTEQAETPLESFTLAFEQFRGTPLDEAPGAAELARRLGLRHHERRVAPDEVEALWTQALVAMDQPSIDGFNVYPSEVESVLLQHPGVVQAAAIGVPHPYHGEVVRAYLVAGQGVTLTRNDVTAHCRRLLAPYKVPKEIRFEAIPKTSTGKIQKFQLRERAKSASAIE